MGRNANNAVRRWATSLLLAAALSGCGGSDETGPYIDQVLPSAAASDAVIEILGERFCGDGAEAAAADGTCTTPPSGFVSLGIDANVVRANVESWKHERITVRVPQAAEVGATVVVVTVNGVASNAAEFEVSQ